MKWQRDFLRGFTDTDGISCLTLARGQGKTTLCAGIAVATLDGPLMKSRAETVIVAGSLQQARVSFRHVKFFMGEKLELRSENGRKIFRVLDTMQGCLIENRLTGAILKCQGNDPRKAHGFAPSLVLCDEPSQWDGRGEAMLSAMRTSAGKQAGFKMVCLGTRPAGPEHWFSRLLDGGADYTQIHAAEQGNALAQLTTSGSCTPPVVACRRTDAEAVRWFRLAAEQGEASAQLILGLMYDTGRGVPQDYVTAHMWLNLATATGHENARKGRETVAASMTREQIAEAQARAREWAN